jgi:hypothetical protein
MQEQLRAHHTIFDNHIGGNDWLLLELILMQKLEISAFHGVRSQNILFRRLHPLVAMQHAPI